MENSNLYFRSFLILLLAVTVAFVWVLLPYYGAIFWGVILAIVFTPLHRRLLARMHKRPSLAALTTVLIIILIVIIPMILITGVLLKEGAIIYKQISSGDLNLGNYFEQIVNVLPASVHDTLTRLGISDIFSLQEKLSAAALQGSKFLATQAVSVGQHTFEFLIGMGVMLYLLFFLLRDGAQLARQSKLLIPLSDDHQRHLYRKFATVVRATVKGNIVVAATQGALGGLIFWFLGIQGALLWGVLMAFLSLLPAIGAALVWAPVAIYFLVTGAIWQGVVLTLFCVLVIGLVDNILRPQLVGKDTKMPDYVILISTLGGITVFGLNGFVIGPLCAALFIACWDLFPAAIALNREE
ncbi:AI-2E family transporter [Paralcaligenes sp. KSB-10]|uniref:AI-2E family transporter n=1 Tax=Paralcaligenes sp. KSB-10 TaxID=2901142 RepID=UPI001E622736|nr:AI-2E family transporter [Paralcaligenes sp. KSB-10]UHL65373.1 AI-2E family transporter [Paralcaligenes sp. KSB-10]